MSRKFDHEDLVARGFHRLDPKLLTNNPPKIAWGEIYKGWSDEQKLAYVEKLACTMNHAAMLIQDERNQILGLCELKEAQLTAMKLALDANNDMIQQQVTTMNEDRQKYNLAIKQLNEKVRMLEAELAKWPTEQGGRVLREHNGADGGSLN